MGFGEGNRKSKSGKGKMGAGPGKPARTQSKPDTGRASGAHSGAQPKKYSPRPSGFSAGSTENRKPFDRYSKKENPEMPREQFDSPRYRKNVTNTGPLPERSSSRTEKQDTGHSKEKAPLLSKFQNRVKGEKRPRVVSSNEKDFHKKEFERRKPSDPERWKEREEPQSGKRFEKDTGYGNTAHRRNPYAEIRRREKANRPVIDDGTMRLNRYIAHSGICSRRQADEYIQAGLITVNDTLITELGTKIIPGTDIVKFNNEPIRTQKLVYILLNKPKDYITTTDDPESRKTVLDLIKGAAPERVFPVGRLDRNTTGVLLLTNDGDLTTKLTHPKYQIKKIYQVELDKNLKHPDFEKILKGFELDDGFIQADELSFVEPGDKKIVGIEIHSGRNLIIRRLFEHLGYQVLRLDRVLFAGLTKKNLSRGKWRFLTEKEIAFLKMMRPEY